MPDSRSTRKTPAIASAAVFIIIVDNVKCSTAFSSEPVLGQLPATLRSVAVQFYLTVVGQLNDMFKQLEDLVKLVR
jgi:hypothetical protein